MSHPEQVGFFTLVAEANRALIAGGRVLEIGSYDVNGTIRSLFATADKYVGVDLDHGPGVDVVGFGHEFDDPDDSYDATISGECFEHDPYWRETFQNMARMTRPGGLVAFSCASRGRVEHGTSRTDATQSPGTQAVGLDYYRNLQERDFQSLPLEDVFSEYRFWYMPTHFDLYFAGVKAGGSGAQLPDDAAVRGLRSLRPKYELIARGPMRLLSKVLPESRYQSMLVRVWNVGMRLDRRAS